MSQPKTILILTSKTGGGHLSLAEALRDRLEDAARTGGAVRIIVADPQPRLIQQHYRFVSRHALWLWAAEYQALDGPKRAALAHAIFSRALAKPLQALLDETQPDLIISTYPFLTSEVSYAQRNRASKAPLILLLSDANGVHAAWLSDRRASAVFATTQETYAQALTAGFPPTRVHLVGWPVRASFARAAGESPAVRRETRSSLGLDPDRFTVFLQGGGEGAARIARTLENLLDARSLTGALQIILAAGSNRTLFERFAPMPYVACLPYTTDIARFMAAADVVMGKAGPNVLFESAILGKPFIATAYIPGQEHANLSFIQRRQLGWVALQPHEQRTLLTTLATQADQRSALAATGATWREWNAAANERIVPLIHGFL